MVDKYLSEKLKVFSFFLIVLVVYIHSYNVVVNIGLESKLIEVGYNSYLQYFISYGVARVAVPIFFVISGFLFFVKNRKFSVEHYISKIKKRAQTLLIPYLIWSIFGLVLYFVLQTIPLSKPFFTRQLIADYNLTELLDRVFLNPIPYQFWFIRDLIVIVVLSPIIYYGLKSTYCIFLGVLFLGWIFETDFVIVSNESVFFFTLGSYVAIFDKSRHITYLEYLFTSFTILWVFILGIKTYFFFLDLEFDLLIKLLHKSSILVGIISLWAMYDKVYGRINLNKSLLQDVFKYTFFIFAFHEPILTIYKKLFYFLMGETELSSFLIYIFAPLITILTSIISAFILINISVGFYKLITGGR